MELQIATNKIFNLLYGKMKILFCLALTHVDSQGRVALQKLHHARDVNANG